MPELAEPVFAAAYGEGSSPVLLPELFLRVQPLSFTQVRVMAAFMHSHSSPYSQLRVRAGDSSMLGTQTCLLQTGAVLQHMAACHATGHWQACGLCTILLMLASFQCGAVDRFTCLATLGICRADHLLAE